MASDTVCLSCGNPYEPTPGSVMACPDCQSNSPAKENGDSGRKSLPAPPVSRGTVSADVANEGVPRAAAAWTAEAAAPKDGGSFLGLFGIGSNEARNGGTPAGVGKGPASPDFVRRRSSLAAELDEVHEEIFELHTEMEVMHRALHQAAIERLRMRRAILLLFTLLAALLYHNRFGLAPPAGIAAAAGALSKGDVGAALEAAAAASQAAAESAAAFAKDLSGTLAEIPLALPGAEPPKPKSYLEEALGEYYPSTLVDAVWPSALDSVWPFA